MGEIIAKQDYQNHDAGAIPYQPCLTNVCLDSMSAWYLIIEPLHCQRYSCNLAIGCSDNASVRYWPPDSLHIFKKGIGFLCGLKHISIEYICEEYPQLSVCLVMQMC